MPFALQETLLVLHSQMALFLSLGQEGSEEEMLTLEIK